MMVKQSASFRMMCQMLWQWRLPLTLGVVCVLVQWAGWSTYLRYERALLTAAPWRLITAHVVHLGWVHLALNLTGMFLIWIWCGRAMRTAAWLIVWVWCAFAIGAGLYLFDVALAWYVGLSGVLHGMLVAGAVAMLPREQHRAWLVLVVVAAKLAWEQFGGSELPTAQWVGGGVIVDAHLYGALSGLLYALSSQARRTVRSRTDAVG